METNNGRNRFVSQINVTPLVDVMLVLLVIFMVTAPMMTSGIDVNLPKADGQAVTKQNEPLVITIDRSRNIYLGSKVLKLAELRQKLTAIRSGSEQAKAVLLKADEAVPYGVVVLAMSEIRKAGIDKVGMVTEPTTAFPADRR
ncbi:protein TolR [bacterium]|nr:MAG: protein TolR [bacterium]